MTRWDSAVSAEAWNDLVARYRKIMQFEEGDEHALLELLHEKIAEVEGE
jgi:hypothetical protein